jgi:hypothetical protein
MDAHLEYELDQGDLEAFFEHHATHAPYIRARNRRMRWIWGGVFALLALAYASRWPAAGLAMLVIGAVFLGFYGSLNRWWYVRHNRRINAGPDAHRPGATRLGIAEGRLHIEAPDGSSQLEMTAIRRIEESGAHFFVYTGPASAVIVPRLDGRAEEFVQALREARSAA